MYRRLRAGTINRDEVHGEDLAPVAESPLLGPRPGVEPAPRGLEYAREGEAHLLLVTGNRESESPVSQWNSVGAFEQRTRGGIGSCVRGRGQTAVGSRRRPTPIGCSSEPHRHARHGLRAELARLLPELLDASQPSGPRPVGDLAQRHRLFDAVNRAITVGDRPRLLIIDDLQWCDAETIELIGFVVPFGTDGTGPYRRYRPLGGDPGAPSRHCTRRRFGSRPGSDHRATRPAR